MRSLLVGILLGGVLVAGVLLWGQRTREPQATKPGVSLAVSRSTALVRAAEEVGSSVVGVITLETRSLTGSDLSQQFFRRFFPDMQGSGNQVSRIGSGIVLDSRGYFLTNHHLVADADRIWVRLSDGLEYEVERVGSDPTYDLAVIRTVDSGGESFVTSPVNLSGDLMVGEWVVALGNPYGNYIDDPRPSVTVGVISGIHRDVKLSDGAAIYKDMIQTDAAINPGNSGGPLVNAAGEVIGINTFILTQGGGSMGLGFAIPIETAIEVAGELIRHGRVRDVWIGIAVQPLNPALANQLGTRDQRGLVVWSLEGGSPAERAGIRLGDLIRAVNGEPVTSARDARRSIFGARVEDTIVFTVERHGELADVPVRLEEIPGQTRGGRP